MPTAGSIITNIQIQAGDPNGDFLTDTIGLDWLSQAEQRFCDKIWALDEIKDYTITSLQYRNDLPTNCIIPLTVTYYQTVTRLLEYCDPSFWDGLMEGMPNGQGTPNYWTVIRRQLLVGPDAPLSNSATSTASGAITSTATTLGLSAASGTFRSRGFVLIGSEVIEYTGISTTTLTGCTRGVHGTTAASYSSTATVTQIDMQMRYRKMPAQLTATTQTPEVPAIWQKYLEKYTLYLYFLSRGDQAKAEVVYNEFEDMEKDAQKTVSKRAQARHQIRDRRHAFTRWWW